VFVHRRKRDNKDSVAIGRFAGEESNTEYTVSAGRRAGYSNQEQYAIAVGDLAGEETQGLNAIAIGKRAGNFSQGKHAIAIGNMAGVKMQPDYSIVISSNETDLKPTEKGLYIDPIRDASATTKGLFYDATTKEIIAATLPPVSTTGSYLDLTNVKKEESIEIKTSNFNAVAGNRYGINTSSSIVTATLPASPLLGDAIFFVDMGGVYSTNNLIIARNGKTIMDIAENLIVDTDNDIIIGQSFGLCWNGTTWRIY